jgi:hypothetical protein
MVDIKTDVQGVYRTEQGYLINKDNEGLQNYRAMKARMVKTNNLADKVDNLESQIAEIKELLIKALNK